MKRIPLALLIIFFGVCFGQLIDPDHAIHHGNELSQECLECHVCKKGEIPSEKNPCLKQCSRPFQINNTKTQDVVIIDKLVEKYEPVVFMHGYHANMSSMSGGCLNCHHYTQSIEDITSCGASGCHDDSGIVDLVMSKPSLKGA